MNLCLGWHAPKPREEDPGAWERVREIMANPGYRQADGDPDFLQSYETRGVRLEIDYLKPETLLQRQGVEHTIVAFGSTRIPEPEVVRRHLEAAREALAESPHDPEVRNRARVAERIAGKSRYYQVARELGQRWAGRAVAQMTAV